MLTTRACSLSPHKTNRPSPASGKRRVQGLYNLRPAICGLRPAPYSSDSTALSESSLRVHAPATRLMLGPLVAHLLCEVCAAPRVHRHDIDRDQADIIGGSWLATR